MQNEILASLTGLSDLDLLARTKALIAHERQATAEIIAHLAELETRELYLREGYPSLFVYCRDALRLSEWEAYNRIEAARAARRFPVILEMLADGSVHLTAVRLLAPHLTPANHREVLASAYGKTKAGIQEIVARLSPRPDVAFSVRRVRTARSGRGTTTEPEMATELSASEPSVIAAPLPGSLAVAYLPVSGIASSPTVSPADTAFAASAAHPAPVPPVPVTPASVTPLSPDRYKLQLTISGETLEKLRLATDMLGHAVPSGEAALIVDRALTALLAELARKKFANTPKPRGVHGKKQGKQGPGAGISKPHPRGVAAAVKRAVWLRDLGRCAFVGTGGHRCNERRFVEFHHVDPYALGGEATVDGIQLRSRRHNDYEGRLYFGRRRGPRSGRELVPEQVGLSASRSTPERPLPVLEPERTNGRPG